MKPIEQMSDAELLAYCGWMEDRGEGVGGCYLVMHCVMNRVKSKEFPNTIREVVFQKNAFSWTRPDNPEHGKQVPFDDPTYLACLEDAQYVIFGDDDPTRGALYYANQKTMTPNGWFFRNIVMKPTEHPLTLLAGAHAFYK